MANRRMFAKDIVDSDAFVEMPLSAQALYFHMGMHADDDGFLSSPKRLMRALSSAEDDLKILIAKRFVLQFDDGVCVVKHWKMNNNIPKDRYTPTVYGEHFATLEVKPNKAYSSASHACIQTVYKSDTQVRLGKDRIDKKPAASREGSKPKKSEAKFTTLGADVIKGFEVVDPKNKLYYNNTAQRAAADFLIEEYGFEEVIKRVSFLPRSNVTDFFPNITTPCQLRDKWVTLENAVDRYRNKKQGAASQVAF